MHYNACQRHLTRALVMPEGRLPGWIDVYGQIELFSTVEEEIGEPGSHGTYRIMLTVRH